MSIKAHNVAEAMVTRRGAQGGSGEPWPTGQKAGVTSPPDPLDVPAVRVELAQDPRAAGQARGAVREVLVRWRLVHLVDAVVLAASELVTNAVRYGRPPVAMQLQRQEGQVRLDVHDGNPAEPADRHGQVHADAESGRGVEIVQALATEFSVEQVDGDGKIVHATFEVGE